MNVTDSTSAAAREASSLVAAEIATKNGLADPIGRRSELEVQTTQKLMTDGRRWRVYASETDGNRAIMQLHQLKAILNECILVASMIMSDQPSLL